MKTKCPPSSREYSPISSPLSQRNNPQKQTLRASFGFDKANNPKSIKFSSNGTIVETAGNFANGEAIVSTTGFNKGVNIWKIKGITVHCCQGVGICTKTGLVAGSEFFLNAKGLGDVYGFDGDGRNEKLFKSVDGTVKETYAQKLGKWSDEESITVILDCEKWQVIKDSTRLGDPIKISPNKTYYPTMGLCSNQPINKYQLFVR